MKIRIGTRASALALMQTQIAVNALKSIADHEYEIIPITTSGDRIQDKPLWDIGGKALFLKEIEEALLADKVDIAVHSMKDVPGQLPEGLIIAAVLEREDPRDVLISYKASKIMDLPNKALIGTSAVRRSVQLLKLRPDLIISALRGNVNTRLQKLKNGEFDGIILAMAGLKRLGLYDPAYCHLLEEDEMIPAVGQGIIALEIRNKDDYITNLCKKINHLPTWQLLQAERGFLEYLNADCKTPMGASAKFDEGKILTTYMLASNDKYRTKIVTSSIDAAYESGVMAAKEISDNS